MYKNNPKYEVAFESKSQKDSQNNPLVFYKLKEVTEYHMSRYVAANAQNVYSESGLTKSLLTEITKHIDKAINENKLSDAAVWNNNLKARIAYPVDENAAIRMAMIYHFIDGEQPDTCENHWTEWKTQKVMADPEAYSFFLPIGLAYTPAYTEYLEEISQSSLQKRAATISLLTPQHPQSK